MTRSIEQQLEALDEDVGHLIDWTHTHDAEHVNEDKRMNLLLAQLAEHDTNHHSRASTIKQGGWVAVTLTIVYAVAEVIRQTLL